MSFWKPKEIVFPKDIKKKEFWKTNKDLTLVKDTILGLPKGTKTVANTFGNNVKKIFQGNIAQNPSSKVGIVQNTIAGLPKATLEVARDIGQATARTVGTVGVEAGNFSTKTSNFFSKKKEELPFASETSTTDNKITNALFGGKPIRDIQSAGQNASNQIDAIRSGITGSEVKPINKNLAIPFGIAGTLIDLSGLGRTKLLLKGQIPEKFFRFVAREMNPAVIDNVLKSSGVTDDILRRNLAEQLATTKTVDDAKDVLNNFNKIDTPAKSASVADKVLQNNEPITLYHTTGNKFENFDNKYLGSNTDAPNTQAGFFFSDNPKNIEDFKNTLSTGFKPSFTSNEIKKDVSNYRVIEKVANKEDFFDLNVANGVTAKQAEFLTDYFGNETGNKLKGQEAIDYVNEYMLSDMEFQSMLDEEMPKIAKELKKKGYKGITSNFGGGVNEYLVFDPNELKTKVSKLESGDQNLIEEAKKYSSAEEFVKAYKNDTSVQNMVHANEKPVIRNISDLMASEDAGTAKLGYGRGIEAKNLIPGKSVDSPIMVLGKNTVIDGNTRLQQAIANGDKTIPTYNVKPIGDYKSQLTDIYNQANKNNADDALINEAKKYKSAEDFIQAKNPIPDYGFIGRKQMEEWGVKTDELRKAYEGKPFYTPEQLKSGLEKLPKEIEYNGEKYIRGSIGEVSDAITGKLKRVSLNLISPKLGVKDIILNGDELSDFYNKAVGKPDIIKQATDARKERLTIEGYIKPEVKQVSDIDRLIMEGKVRIVSRNNKDIYQYKKSGNWVNARDEDSVIKQTTKNPLKKKEVVIPPKLEQEIVENEILTEQTKDLLRWHPAKKLLRFQSKKEGQFLDMKDPSSAKTIAERDRIIERNKKINARAEVAFEGTELADRYDDPDIIREKIDEYNDAKEKLATLKQEKKEILSRIKENKVLKPEPKKATVSLQTPKDTQKSEISQGEAKSIEIQARQVKELLDSDFDSQINGNVSLPKIIAKNITPVQSKVHFIDTFLTTPKFVMQKIGFGKEYADLRKAMDEYWKELPKNINKIEDWSKQVPKESNARIFKYLDGQAIDLNKTEQKVADEVRAWLKNWADRLGLKEDNRVTDYITRLFDDGSTVKEFDEDLAKLITDKIPGSVYSPFTLKRLGAEGYKENTWEALDAYVKRSTRKVYLDPVLEKIQAKTGGSLEYSNIEESQFKYIQKYIENINMRPTNADKSIDNFIKSLPLIGNKLGQRPISVLTRTLRQMTYRGMLGLNPSSALRNLSQGINTYATLGEKYTALGYAGLFKKGSLAELKREGVLSAGFVQDKVLSATKKKIQMLDKGLFAMFETVERINRGAAYFGAKAKALQKGKTEDEAIDYAKDIVRKTQFVFDSVDSPVGLSGDLMKTLFQFQNFTTKQIEFLGGMAKDKNLAGLARYTIAGLAFVYTIGKAFGMEPKELLPWYRFNTPPSLKFPVETVKAIANAPDAYGKPRTFKKKVEDVVKSGIGLIPAGTQIKKSFEGLKSVSEGGSFSKNGRLQFKQGQTPIEKGQSVLFGKYASSNAKNYFNKESINKKEQEPIRKIFDQVQSLKMEGKEAEAQSIVNNLSDEDYAVYKKIRSSEKAKDTELAKKEMVPTVIKLKKLVEDGREEEAQMIIDDMTDEEYRIYNLAKKQFN